MFLTALFGKVTLQKVQQAGIDVACIGLEHNGVATHWTAAFIVPLKLDEAADAKYVGAFEAHGLDCDALADGAKVVVELGDNAEHPGGHGVADCAGEL